MPSLLRGAYAPPGSYVRTEYDRAPEPGDVPAVLPLYIGTGRETLTQGNLPVVRGSSATSDERLPDEDMTGRAVRRVNPDGTRVLGVFDGTVNQFQVRNLPMTTGEGTGTVTTDTASVSVTLNGQAVVVLGVNGATGVVEIAEYPDANDRVLCTYYFDRTDTEATDDVSAQVTSTPAQLDGAVGQNFLFAAGVNDRFVFTPDGRTPVTVVMPSGAGAVAATVVVAAINAAAGLGSAQASSYVNHLGRTCIRLTADVSLSIGSGSANGVLGFVAGAATARNRTFYVFNGPMVRGTGGGVTTTRPVDVTVTVDGVEVPAFSVDGRTRAVTLSAAPPVGAQVLIRYWHNTWQDTYDYLAHTGIRTLDRVALTPESNGAGVYVPGVDYVLKNDTVIWGTAVQVSSGVHTEGGEVYGPAQVTARLVDQRAYLLPCTAVVAGSGAVARVSQTQFQLPEQPVTGDGRGNPLGTSLYAATANGRSDLPATDPHLVTLYWGYGPQDALRRGAVPAVVLDAESSRVTLAAAVPAGATVYATFYYNTLVDAAFTGSGRGYTLTSVTAGNSGVGAYTLTDGAERALYAVSLGAKGAALATVTVVFPSGSEFLPDARIEGGAPVEETVTVQFATADATPARYVTPGAGPYYLVSGQSSALRLTIDGSASSTGGAGGIDLALPSGGARAGAFASLLGSEVSYTAASGETTFPITAGVDDAVSVLVDGVSLTGTAAAGATRTLSHYATGLNTASLAAGTRYVAATTFDASYTVVVNLYDQMRFIYTGDVSGATAIQSITLTPGVYATATALAAEVNARIVALGGTFVLTCAATADSQLRFTFSKDPADGAGLLEFITVASAARDFAIVAGIDCGAAAAGNQTKLYHGPVATTFTVTATASRLPYDRLVLRNRILPGGNSLAPYHALAQCQLVAQGGNGAAQAGLPAGFYGEAAYRGAVLGPQLRARVGWAGGVASAFADTRDGQPWVTFYNGGDTALPANNVFKVTIGGTLHTVTFTASSSGTATALGPASVAGSVLYQMNTVLTAAVGGVVAVQEGDSIRIHGTTADSMAPTMLWIVGNGSANALLGFAPGAVATPNPVTARQLASALMAHVQTYASWVLNPATVGTGYFASRALAGVTLSSTGEEYLYIQSRTLGSASALAFATASSADALRPGTGLGTVSGDGARGATAVEGYFVTSSDGASGSGSANTSVFNSGVGADGVVGQTYRDAVTGLRFTILPREGGQAYPVGSTATVSFRISRTFLTDANVPTLAVPGVELTAANTAGVVPGDTVRVETYSRAGAEPTIGETYYVTYTYTKADFTPKVFSRIGDVEAEYGPATPEYPLSLAADFAFKNGSSLVACQQVLRMAGSNQASEASYLSAIDALGGNSLPGDLAPGVIVPLTPATRVLARHLALHCDLQSSIRYRAERTALLGFASGTRPDQLNAIIRSAGSMLVRFVYPDIASIQITDLYNRTRTYLVDGRYIAAALAASTTSSGIDPATPWESRQLYGFLSLGRRLDPPVANAVAQLGCTVVETRGGTTLRIRHGLTSDMSNVLTRTPTVAQIDHELHRRARAVMDPYVGNKFLSHLLGQIEGRLTEMFKQAVRDQIITAFKGVKVELDPEDPTALLSDGWWMPVFPALYMQLLLRVSSTAP